MKTSAATRKAVGWGRRRMGSMRSSEHGGEVEQMPSFWSGGLDRKVSEKRKDMGSDKCVQSPCLGVKTPDG